MTRHQGGGWLTRERGSSGTVSVITRPGSSRMSGRSQAAVSRGPHGRAVVTDVAHDCAHWCAEPPYELSQSRATRDSSCTDVTWPQRLQVNMSVPACRSRGHRWAVTAHHQRLMFIPTQGPRPRALTGRFCWEKEALSGYSFERARHRPVRLPTPDQRCAFSRSACCADADRNVALPPAVEALLVSRTALRVAVRAPPVPDVEPAGPPSWSTDLLSWFAVPWVGRRHGYPFPPHAVDAGRRQGSSRPTVPRSRPG